MKTMMVVVVVEVVMVVGSRSGGGSNNRGNISVKKQEFQELHEIQLYTGLPEIEKILANRLFDFPSLGLNCFLFLLIYACLFQSLLGKQVFSVKFFDFCLSIL